MRFESVDFVENENVYHLSMKTDNENVFITMKTDNV